MRGAVDHAEELVAGHGGLDEAGLVAEHAEKEVRAAGEDPHHGPANPAEEPQRARDQERVSLGPAQGQRLGDELPDHQREIRDGQDDDHERDMLAVRAREPGPHEERGDVLRPRGTPERRGPGPNHRDPDLDRREEPLGVITELSEIRAGAPLARELRDPRRAHGHHGDLGGREDPVQHHERDDDEQLEDEGHGQLRGQSTCAVRRRGRSPHRA